MARARAAQVVASVLDAMATAREIRLRSRLDRRVSPRGPTPLPSDPGTANPIVNALTIKSPIRLHVILTSVRRSCTAMHSAARKLTCFCTQ